jgi:hypothetical protein
MNQVVGSCAASALSTLHRPPVDPIPVEALVATWSGSHRNTCSGLGWPNPALTPAHPGPRPGLVNLDR